MGWVIADTKQPFGVGDTRYRRYRMDDGERDRGRGSTGGRGEGVDYVKMPARYAQS